MHCIVQTVGKHTSRKLIVETVRSPSVCCLARQPFRRAFTPLFARKASGEQYPLVALADMYVLLFLPSASFRKQRWEKTPPGKTEEKHSIFLFTRIQAPKNPTSNTRRRGAAERQRRPRMLLHTLRIRFRRILLKLRVRHGGACLLARHTRQQTDRIRSVRPSVPKPGSRIASTLPSKKVY